VDADSLFLHKLNDLEPRLGEVATDYEVLGIAGLVRDLLLDGSNSVVDQVNRTRRLRWEFVTTQESELERMILEMNPSFRALGDGIDAETAFIPAAREPWHVTRDQFLARRVIVVAGSDYLVKDVVQVSANVLGARHLGQGRTDPEKQLARDRYLTRRRSCRTWSG